MGRRFYAVPPMLPKQRPLNYDYNGITGLDWSLSEVVFHRYPYSTLSAKARLSVELPPMYSSSSTI